MLQSSSIVHAMRYAAERHNKARFHTHAKTLLRRLAGELHLDTSARDIRSCLGGPVVLGEAILHTDDVYVMVHRNGVMFRTCNGRKDYSGGTNQNAMHDILSDPHAFALRLMGMSVARQYQREQTQASAE
jgi:hypothetical protein